MCRQNGIWHRQGDDENRKYIILQVNISIHSSELKIQKKPKKSLWFINETTKEMNEQMLEKKVNY